MGGNYWQRLAGFPRQLFGLDCGIFMIMGDDQIEVALWREAAVHKVDLGAQVWLSHKMKCLFGRSSRTGFKDLISGPPRLRSASWRPGSRRESCPGSLARRPPPQKRSNLLRDTQFLRTSPVAVSEELAGEVLSALFPPSSLTNIGQVRGKRGLVTVEGQVVEISAVKKISVGREQVPKRTVRLQEGDDQIEVALWREAAVHKVDLGAQVRLSHLCFGSAAFVDQLQSTAFTAVEIQANVVKQLSSVEVLGVLESEEEGRLYLVLEDDVQYKVEASLWEPFEEELRKRRLFVGVNVVGVSSPQ
ncbi:uncharacterized protein ACNS7B_009247 [Menidia menidia]